MGDADGEGQEPVRRHCRQEPAWADRQHATPLQRRTPALRQRRARLLRWASGMSTKARRFDLYPDEFIVGTLDLTLEERGLYMTICCLLYSRGKPIERCHADLAKKCGCSARLVATVLQRLLDKRKRYLTPDGQISNERCEQEIAKAAKRIERAREAGLEGGRPAISNPGSAPTHART